MIERNNPFLQSLWYHNFAFVTEQSSGPATTMKLIKSVRCVMHHDLLEKEEFYL